MTVHSTVISTDFLTARGSATRKTEDIVWAALRANFPDGSQYQASTLS
jgi:hypothetical protein